MIKSMLTHEKLCASFEIIKTISYHHRSKYLFFCSKHKKGKETYIHELNGAYCLEGAAYVIRRSEPGSKPLIRGKLFQFTWHQNLYALHTASGRLNFHTQNQDANNKKAQRIQMLIYKPQPSCRIGESCVETRYHC